MSSEKSCPGKSHVSTELKTQLWRNLVRKKISVWVNVPMYKCITVMMSMTTAF